MRTGASPIRNQCAGPMPQPETPPVYPVGKALGPTRDFGILCSSHIFAKHACASGFAAHAADNEQGAYDPETRIRQAPSAKERRKN